MIFIITVIIAIVSIEGKKFNTDNDLRQLKILESNLINHLEKYILQLDDKLNFLNG